MVAATFINDVSKLPTKTVAPSLSEITINIPENPLNVLKWTPTWTPDPDYQIGDRLDLFVNGVDAGSSVTANKTSWEREVDLVDGENVITLGKIRNGEFITGLPGDPEKEPLAEATVLVELPVLNSENPIVLNAVQIKTHNSITIEALLDSNRMFQIEYWKTSAGQVTAERTRPDTTGNYGNPIAHRQTMINLLPETEYTYRFLTSSDGVVFYYFGDTKTVITEVEPVIPASDANLGYGYFGWNMCRENILLNSSNQYETAICFTALESATVNTMRVANRTLRDIDVTNRKNSGEAYRLGFDEGLSGQQTSMLFNYWAIYCWGNPRFRPAICKQDAQGLPNTNTIMAEANIYTPYSYSDGPQQVDFTSTFNIVAGERYALIFQNIDPLIDPAPFNYRNGVSAANLAKSWIDSGNTGGYWGNNGSVLGAVDGLKGPHQSPAWGDKGAYTCYKNKPTAAWRKQPGRLQIPWFRYLNNDTSVWTGYGWWGYHFNTRQRDIYGDNWARQITTIPDGFNFNSDRVWVMARHNHSITPNGDPLTLTIKKDASTVATGTAPPNYAVAANNRNTQGITGAVGTTYKYQTEWFLINLSTTHNFNNGSYEFILTAPSVDSAWVIDSIPIHKDEADPYESSVFSPATSQAQFSSDAGSTWGNFPPVGVDSNFPADDWYLGIQVVRVGEPNRQP